MADRKILILAEGRFGVLDSKTATCVIRYAPDEVVGVLDSKTAGGTSDRVLGFGPALPIVATLDEGLELGPDTFLIGVAPRGGRLPAAWREMVKSALEAGLEVVSGLHTFLGDDQELAAVAARSGARITDLRRVPDDLPVASRKAAAVDATVVLTVGTDCNVGKMTASVELAAAARRMGFATAFAPTGQTGLFLGGKGLVVDRVIADFIAGAAETIVLDNAPDQDFVFVEGQGSLLHPGYSGVTLGLIHGSQPDAMILVHQPTRLCTMNDEIEIMPLPDWVELHERMAGYLKPARVVGVAINGYDLDESAARDWAERITAETGLPAVDPVKFGAEPLIEAILAADVSKPRPAAARRRAKGRENAGARR
ncbi:MAG TPA: DUF1611 domain-containing protein [Gemmatimonadota bacterium]|nr:DUF1611 domain-containing protein [Gemmatimonadota bacterium]